MGGFFLRSHDYSKSSLSRITKQTNPIETGLLANTVIRKSTSFLPRLLSVGLTQVINSLRSRKKSDHNAVKFSDELNFRHSRFISYLFTIHSQGLLHFAPRRIRFNHDSRNSFLSNHDSQSTKTLDVYTSLARVIQKLREI